MKGRGYAPYASGKVASEKTSERMALLQGADQEMRRPAAMPYRA